MSLSPACSPDQQVLFDNAAYSDTSHWPPLGPELFSDDDVFDLLTADQPKVRARTIFLKASAPNATPAVAPRRRVVLELGRSGRVPADAAAGLGHECSHDVQAPTVGVSQPIRRRVRAGTPTRRSRQTQYSGHGRTTPPSPGAAGGSPGTAAGAPTSALRGRL